MTNRIIHGDAFIELPKMDDKSVDLIITDPPYGLKFMGKKWDYDVPSVRIWKECLRVLKPGGYLLSFAGTRTQHRMACNIEDAGFEIRDMIAWVYGSGFPKSHNIGKAIQKTQGVELEDTGIISPISRPNVNEDLYKSGKVGKNFTIKSVTTKTAKEWEGWGTALKPAFEPITIARKPLSEKTVAKNVLKWKTGGINIDRCRVEGENVPINKLKNWSGFGQEIKPEYKATINTKGRFPANFIHDGSDEVLELFPEAKPTKPHSVKSNIKSYNGYGNITRKRGEIVNYNEGNKPLSAARFFYCAKASKKERNAGLDGANNHPTVKPIALMEYLIKLVGREGAIVLDPFMGTGTTGIACINLNYPFIGIELDEDYFKIAEMRINNSLYNK